jgi:phosphatidylserine decarboxylase
MKIPQHQYIERATRRVMTERLYGDRIISYLYNSTREQSPALFKALTSSRMSDLLSMVNYELPTLSRLAGAHRFVERLGIDLSECVQPAERLNTAKKIFERQIRYWETRPMPTDPDGVVSPADGRLLVGSLADTSQIFLKEKFFNLEELIGFDRSLWLQEFRGGDFAVFRLTPDKYHYNHAPVSGRVLEIYEIPGCYHPANPSAVVTIATPYSKNKRVVTIIDTEVVGGTGIGLVAMIEIVALMIGDIVQCYSRKRYDSPQFVVQGLFLEKGCPKSLYRPGSSTDVLVFQKNRVRFCDDIIANMRHQKAYSRYSQGFGAQLVETDVQVRSLIGRAIAAGNGGSGTGGSHDA